MEFLSSQSVNQYLYSIMSYLSLFMFLGRVRSIVTDPLSQNRCHRSFVSEILCLRSVVTNRCLSTVVTNPLTHIRCLRSVVSDSLSQIHCYRSIVSDPFSQIHYLRFIVSDPLSQILALYYLHDCT